MRLFFAFLLLAGCVSSPETASSSGGESAAQAPTDESPPVPLRRSSAGPETGNELDDPPAHARVESVEGVESEESEESEESAVASDETPNEAGEATAEPSRPSMILAPARAGQVRLRDVREVMRSHQSEITTCYEEGLSRERSLAGEVKVRFLIGPRGRLEDAEVYETSLGDEGVEACILAAMRTWRYPRPRPRGSSALLTYPYFLATE